MDAATVFRVLSLIPDRTAFSLSGCATSAAATCKYPERLAFVMQRQHWLSPLDAISKDEQRMLGLHAVHGRPLQEPGEEPELGEELEPEDTEVDLEESFVATAPAEEEPATATL